MAGSATYFQPTYHTMRPTHHLCTLLLLGLFALHACTQYLSAIEEISVEQQQGVYQILRDVAYGPDPEQNMDIYLSNRAIDLGQRNYTIVFVHGGAYYLSDKREEEKYIKPYLSKGMNVVNLNYRLKRGIPMATSDVTNALNYLSMHNDDYPLELGKIVVTGFSAGAQMVSNVGLAQNNSDFPDQLNPDLTIVAIINFSGPVDQLDVIEKIFTEHEYELFREAGIALFPQPDYPSKEYIAIYEPITYFDKNDPPVFLWHGGHDDQIPPATFQAFASLMREDTDQITYIPEAKHSPTPDELTAAYAEIFQFLDNL